MQRLIAGLLILLCAGIAALLLLPEARLAPASVPAAPATLPPADQNLVPPADITPPAGPGSSAAMDSAPPPPAHQRQLVHLPDRKYPWRIHAREGGADTVYAATHVLVSGIGAEADLRDALAHTDCRIERITDDLFQISWSGPVLEQFDQVSDLLARRLPNATIDKDYLNRKTAWTEGERLADPDYLDRMGQKWLYENGYNANGFAVALIDSGINASHPDLLESVYTNTNETINGSDDDKNGFIDDVSGWDFVDNDNNPDDLDGHGTAISAIIAANGSNGIGVAGFAPGSRVVPLKMLDQGGEGFDSDAIKAITYAQKAGLKVINASWGRQGTATTALRNTIQTYINSGGVFVASAGNDHQDIDTVAYSPASLSLDGMIVVGGGDSNYLTRNSSSNFGATALDIFAPFRLNTVKLDSADIQFLSGTSFSAAVVTALTAVLRKNQPQLSSLAAADRLLKTAVFMPGVYGLTRYPGYPNAERLLNDIRSPLPRITGYTRDKDPVHVGEEITLTFQIEGDEHVALAASGLYLVSSNVNGNQITVDAALDRRDYQVGVRGLLGQTDFGTVSVQAVHSAPYLSYEMPHTIRLEELTETLSFDVTTTIRGDQPIWTVWMQNGVAITYMHGAAIRLNNSPASAGEHRIHFSNATGDTDLTITATWQGKLPVIDPPRHGTPMRLGNNFLYYANGYFMLYDGVKSTPLEDFHDFWYITRHWTVDDMLFIDGSNHFSTRDGISWQGYRSLSGEGPVIGKYQDRYAYVGNSFIYLLNPDTGGYDLLHHNWTVDRLSANTATNGSLLLTVYDNQIRKYVDQAGWEPVSDPLPPVAHFCYNGEAFLHFPLQDGSLTYSADGAQWATKPISYPEGANPAKIFRYNNQPGLVARDILYGYDFPSGQWVPLIDFVNKQVFQQGLTEPLYNKPFLFIGGRVRGFFEEADFCLATLEGVYAVSRGSNTLGDRTWFSTDLVDWTAIASTPTGFTQLNGETYLLDADGLYRMRGPVRLAKVGPGVQTTAYVLFYRDGYFMAKVDGSNSGDNWRVLDKDGVWKDRVYTDVLQFDSFLGKYRLHASDPWINLGPFTNIHATDGRRQFRGRSIQFVDGGFDVMTMEDAELLSDAAYDAFPNAAFSGEPGWFEDPVLGWLRPGGDYHLWSLDHGWLAFVPTGGRGVYLYDGALGWLYYDPVSYPYLFSYGRQAWLYYLKGTRAPRWFFDYGQNGWLELN